MVKWPLSHTWLLAPQEGFKFPPCPPREGLLPLYFLVQDEDSSPGGSPGLGFSINAAHTPPSSQEQSSNAGKPPKFRAQGCGLCKFLGWASMDFIGYAKGLKSLRASMARGLTLVREHPQGSPLDDRARAPGWAPKPARHAVIPRPLLLGSCSDSHWCIEESGCQCPWGPRGIILKASEGSRPMVFRQRSSRKVYSRFPSLGQEEIKQDTREVLKRRNVISAMREDSPGRGTGLAEARAGLCLCCQCSSYSTGT